MTRVLIQRWLQIPLIAWVDKFPPVMSRSPEKNRKSFKEHQYHGLFIIHCIEFVAPMINYSIFGFNTPS